MILTEIDIQTVSQAVMAAVAAGFGFAKAIAALIRAFRKS